MIVEAANSVHLLMADPSLLRPHICRLPGTRPGIQVDQAMQEWNGLHTQLQSEGFTVHLHPAQTATSAFIGDAALTTPPGRPGAFASMRLGDERVEDPAMTSAWLRHRMVPRSLWAAVGTIAGGDLLWGPNCLFAGIGRASSPVAARSIAQGFGTKALPLRLIDARWPTLDQALCVLGPNHALWAPQAFDLASGAAIEAIFDHLEAVPEPSALPLGKRVVVSEHNLEAKAAISSLDFEPILVPLESWQLADAGPSALVQRIPL